MIKDLSKNKPFGKCSDKQTIYEALTGQWGSGQDMYESMPNCYLVVQKLIGSVPLKYFFKILILKKYNVPLFHKSKFKLFPKLQKVPIHFI